jgi:erythromycin esterase
VARGGNMVEAASASPQMLAALRGQASPLRSSADLDPLMERIGDARCVLLGEASHGTHEFYTWRAELSKRLIQEKGFSFLAVEGDWPDCYCLNRYAKGYAHAGNSAYQVLETFARWPTWMWANEEVAEFVEWLRRFNHERPESRKVGFYGLDVYSLWDSLHQVMRYLERAAPEALPAARRALSCFEPYGEDVQSYAIATMFAPDTCQHEVVQLLAKVRQAANDFRSDGRDGHFAAEQNALVVKNAETYYRTMIRSNVDSWNVRDKHMAQTLDRLLDHHGQGARAIVWEHNTHIGDARFTDMLNRGELNVGQQAREHYGEDQVVLVGFSTHRGTVIAGREWGAPMEEMRVPVALAESWEDLLHRSLNGDSLLVFDSPRLSEEFLDWRGHRAIGVVYHPEHEQHGNYVPTILPRRYDALVFIDASRALDPLPVRGWAKEEVPETFPTGV